MPSLSFSTPAEPTQILQDNGKPLSNFEFTYAIGKDLVLPAIQRRYANSNGLQIAVVNKMHRVFGIKEAMHHAVDTPTKSGRCFKCIEAIMSSPKYISERNRLNNKLKTKCFQCNKYICKVHQVEFICGDCKQINIFFFSKNDVTIYDVIILKVNCHHFYMYLLSKVNNNISFQK